MHVSPIQKKTIQPARNARCDKRIQKQNKIKAVIIEAKEKDIETMMTTLVKIADRWNSDRLDWTT